MLPVRRRTPPLFRAPPPLPPRLPPPRLDRAPPAFFLPPPAFRAPFLVAVFFRLGALFFAADFPGPPAVVPQLALRPARAPPPCMPLDEGGRALPAIPDAVIDPPVVVPPR